MVLELGQELTQDGGGMEDGPSGNAETEDMDEDQDVKDLNGDMDDIGDYDDMEAAEETPEGSMMHTIEDQRMPVQSVVAGVDGSQSRDDHMEVLFGSTTPPQELHTVMAPEENSMLDKPQQDDIVVPKGED